MMSLDEVAAALARLFPAARSVSPLLSSSPRYRCQLTSIASAPGVDVLWVGHNDLSQSLGVPGQYDHKRFTDALRLVLDTANRFGLKAGIQPGTMAQAQGWLDFGFNIISYGTDLSIYRQAVTSQVSELRQMTKTS
jgi:2-dehydro-3-deoxyglucarate aldolase/4-hydroxy-2-oxoheptanedioate aldolase